MTPRIYVVGRKEHSKRWCQAFAAGCGGEISTEFKMGPWAAFHAPDLHQNLLKVMKAGHDFYLGDHAYFGRWKYWRVTKNAFQHDGTGEPDFEKLKPYHRHAKPWRKGGRHILVCTQTQAYYERFGIPDWLENTVARLRLHSDRPIIVREKNTTRPLELDFQHAHCVVACTSNVAVEALMQGIPVIVTGQCAASRMGLCDPALVEYPYYPAGRMEWAGALAANQWTFEEIAKGLCWEKIQ